MKETSTLHSFIWIYTNKIEEIQTIIYYNIKCHEVTWSKPIATMSLTCSRPTFPREILNSGFSSTTHKSFAFYLKDFSVGRNTISVERNMSSSQVFETRDNTWKVCRLWRVSSEFSYCYQDLLYVWRTLLSD